MSIEVGAIIKGKVTSIQSFGAFVQIEGENVKGLVHISEVANTFVKDINEFLKEGDEVEAKVINIDNGGKKISLSIKALLPEPEKKEKPERKSNGDRPRRNGNNKGGKRGEKESISYRDAEEGTFNCLGDKLREVLK